MPDHNFFLDKWYLDFTGEKGECMIFYAARLNWHGFKVSYASHIDATQPGPVKVTSHFRDVEMPVISEDLITWTDKRLKVSGEWRSQSDSLNCRVFNSNEGALDWNSFQPSSRVKLKVGGKTLEGIGYVEKLNLNIPPWKIPMKELRWGRFIADPMVMVWIELLDRDKKQWVWLNGENLSNCKITDQGIYCNDPNIDLKLKPKLVIESEKKIHNIVKDLVSYLPGFRRVMPVNFLMAENHKWLSEGIFQRDNETSYKGLVIHEWVDFNSYES